MNQALTAGIDYRRVPLAMVVIALIAIPISFLQTRAGVLEGHPTFVALFGFASLSVVGFLSYWFVFRHLPARVKRNPFLILFAVFAYATMLDLLIALSLLGYTDVMNGYFETGEPYLKSSYGMACNLWDGIAHLAMYVGMAYYLAKSEPHRRLAMFWTGSLMSACGIYMLGNLIGEYAEYIEPSYAINIPFMIVPVFYAWKIVSEDKTSVGTGRAPMAAHDYLLALGLLALAFLCAFRMLVVLNPAVSLTHNWAANVEPYLLAPARYPQMQMLAYGFTLMPFAVLAALSLWRAPSRGIAIWAWLFAGFVCQGQFAHIVGNLNAATKDAQFAIGQGATLQYWSANLVVVLIPLWFAWRYEDKLRGAQR
ncbi:MAG TPA: hypothetical protein VLC91_08425 [Spongiibacteraceae bacterium]|nr:hypothetical protein [Spongiibacteraceae bacterium]